jgi:uncharacterized membrane protein
MELPTNYLLIPFATGALITISLVALAISLGISIYTIVATGAFQRMCLKAYDGVDVQVKDLVEVKGYWLKLLGLYLWMTFRIFLWSLLFVIPGIIAAYRYALAPYLMFEDPSKGINRVIGESAVLMRGYKGDLFILDLSFIGWWLLVGVTFGIAILFVGPYYEVARAGAYRSIRYLNTSRQPQTSVPGIASYAPTTNVDASASMPDASPPVTVMESGEIDPVIIEIIEE